MSSTKIPANDPALRSWVDVPSGSDFPIQNLPFGCGYRKDDPDPSVWSRIGDFGIDLDLLFEEGLLPQAVHQDPTVFLDHLNGFLLDPAFPRAVRQRLSELLRDNADANGTLRDTVRKALVPVSELTMEIPVLIGDYTDFYSSRQHAYNVGCMFRDPANALLPNWLHLPVGYHGRASSIIPDRKSVV